MRAADPDAQGINFFRLVVNPDSFGQSVENVFYTSFLIRERRAAVRIEDDGEIIISMSRSPLLSSRWRVC